MDAQAALALAKKINDLDVQIQSLKEEQDRLSSMFRVQWEHRSLSQSHYLIHHSIDESITENATRKIKQIFSNSPQEVFSLSSLRSMVPDVPDETLRATLSRLAARDFIESKDRGLYKYSK